MSASIRPVSTDDAAPLARIYNHYIAETWVTFETDPIGAGDMASRIADAEAASLPWLVAEDRAEILGFAYASRWQGRCAYRFSVESTIYLDADKTGRGIGGPLYETLITAVRARDMHSMIGGIALPNEASVKLHERLGFRKVGQFEQVGFKFDRWIDVGYWQLSL